MSYKENRYLLRAKQLLVSSIIIYMDKMKAFGVGSYGPVENFCEKELPKPSDLSPRDLLVRYVCVYLLSGLSVNVSTALRLSL